MVSNSAKLDRRTKQHTQFGVSASNGSRDMARTKVAEKKEKKKKKKMNVDDSIKHPLRESLIIRTHTHTHTHTHTQKGTLMAIYICVWSAQ